MVEVMTDKQFKTILEMVNMILDGCKDLAEAKEKVQKLIENQGGKKEESRRKPARAILTGFPLRWYSWPSQRPKRDSRPLYGQKKRPG